ncbi:MAG: hypothetical protein H0V32_02475 [Nocardioidaceae bacterium]|nr:hypothetical protein [Nocardioidaceae bacterium]
MAVGRDLDAVDQEVEQVLDGCGCAVVDRGAEQFADSFELFARGNGRGGGAGLCGEFVAAVDEVVALLGQFFYAGSADLVGHVAGFEGAQVAVERGGGVADLGFDAGQLVGQVGLVAVDLGDGLGDGVLEQVDVGVGVKHGVDDGRFESVGAHALCGAGAFAFGLS